MFRVLGRPLLAAVVFVGCSGDDDVVPSDAGTDARLGEPFRDAGPSPSEWESAEEIEALPGDSFGPRVAVDDEGSAVVVWATGETRTTAQLWSARYAVDTGWSDAAPIEDGAAAPAGWVLAGNPAGDVVVVWYREDEFAHTMWANHYDAREGWGTAEQIARAVWNDMGTSLGPEVAIDHAGNAVALWRQREGAEGEAVWARPYVADTGWGLAERISPTVILASSAHIDVDATGNAIATWDQYDGTDARVETTWARHYTVGLGWGESHRLSDDGTLRARRSPRIAIDEAGNGFVVWFEFGSMDREHASMWACRYTVAGGWGTANPIGTGHSADIAVDSAGSAIAIWRRGDPISGPSAGLYANRYDAEAEMWEAETRIDSEGAEPAYGAALAIDGAGNAVAVWYGEDSRDAHWNRFAVASGWDVSRILTSGIVSDVASNGSGATIAVGVEPDASGETNVWARRLEFIAN